MGRAMCTASAVASESLKKHQEVQYLSHNDYMQLKQVART